MSIMPTPENETRRTEVLARDRAADREREVTAELARREAARAATGADAPRSLVRRLLDWLGLRRR